MYNLGHLRTCRNDTHNDNMVRGDNGDGKEEERDKGKT